MKRREFIGCATALAMVPSQGISGGSARAATARPVGKAGRPAAGLELTHPIVDIGIVCSHFKESLRFYHEQLGLEIVEDVRVPDAVARGAGLAPRGFRQVRLRAGNTLIKLMEIESPPARRSHKFAAGVRWLTFFVEDVQSTFEQLKAKGVKFLTVPVTTRDVPGLVCALDPDGILIELVERKRKK